MPRIFAIANQKGGVGKTTTAVNFAASLAASECRVALIDLDPQSNATSALGIKPEVVVQDAYRALIAVASGDTSPVSLSPTSLEHLMILPGSIDAAAIEREFSQIEEPQRVLDRLIKVSPELLELDYIIIDTPPGIGFLTINSLVAATDVIIPVQAEYLSLEGLSQMIDTMDRIRANFNEGLCRAYVLITMSDPRLRLARAVEEELRSKLSNHEFIKVTTTVIPRTVKLAEAPSFGLPVILYDPASAGSSAYIKFTAEVRAI